MRTACGTTATHRVDGLPHAPADRRAGRSRCHPARRPRPRPRPRPRRHAAAHRAGQRARLRVRAPARACAATRRDLDGADQVGRAAADDCSSTGGRTRCSGCCSATGSCSWPGAGRAVGLPGRAVVGLVRRRGAWMLADRAAHGVLLWAGDIVGAYGLLGVLMAGLLVRGADRALLITAAVGAAGGHAARRRASLPPPGDAQAACRRRWRSPTRSRRRWSPGRSSGSAVGLLVAGARGVRGGGARARGRRGARLLDEPERHRPLLVPGRGRRDRPPRCCGGLPLALMAGAAVDRRRRSGDACSPARCTRLGGYAGGAGLRRAVRAARDPAGRARRPGPAARALRACGQRSLSCYLAQSVAFVALLPAWTLGLGGGAHAGSGAVAVGDLAGDPAGRRGVGPGRVPRPGRGAAAPAHLRPSRARRRALITPVSKPARCSPPWKRACSTFRQRSITTSSPPASAAPGHVLVEQPELQPERRTPRPRAPRRARRAGPRGGGRRRRGRAPPAGRPATGTPAGPGSRVAFGLTKYTS